MPTWWEGFVETVGVANDPQNGQIGLLSVVKRNKIRESEVSLADLGKSVVSVFSVFSRRNLAFSRFYFELHSPYRSTFASSSSQLQSSNRFTPVPNAIRPRDCLTPSSSTATRTYSCFLPIITRIEFHSCPHCHQFQFICSA